MTPIACNQNSTQPLTRDIAVAKMPSSRVIERLPVHHMLDAARARTTACKLAGQFGYGLIDQLRLAAAFELAQFLITWTGTGELFILWYKNTPPPAPLKKTGPKPWLLAVMILYASLSTRPKYLIP